MTRRSALKGCQVQRGLVGTGISASAVMCYAGTNLAGGVFSGGGGGGG